MKSIINGLRYDTDKATLIGSASGGGYSMNDFRYWLESLYRTPRSGRFFVAGRGGAMSRWAKRVPGDNGWMGSSGIIPMTDSEAREWAEEHLTAEQIEAAGFAIEDA
jgi:hypothetical protein